jgi:hypothetical protein
MSQNIPNMGRWLSAALSAFACLNAMLAIVYSQTTTADPSLAQQNHDIWNEAAFFAALCVAAAILVVSARKTLVVAAAIVLLFLGLVAVGDIVNARTLTASAIGLVFLIGNLAGASVAWRQRWLSFCDPPLVIPAAQEQQVIDSIDAGCT